MSGIPFFLRDKHFAPATEGYDEFPWRITRWLVDRSLPPPPGPVPPITFVRQEPLNVDAFVKGIETREVSADIDGALLGTAMLTANVDAEILGQLVGQVTVDIDGAIQAEQQAAVSVNARIQGEQQIEFVEAGAALEFQNATLEADLDSAIQIANLIAELDANAAVALQQQSTLQIDSAIAIPDRIDFVKLGAAIAIPTEASLSIEGACQLSDLISEVDVGATAVNVGSVSVDVDAKLNALVENIEASADINARVSVVGQGDIEVDVDAAIELQGITALVDVDSAIALLQQESLDVGAHAVFAQSVSADIDAPVAIPATPLNLLVDSVLQVNDVIDFVEVNAFLSDSPTKEAGVDCDASIVVSDAGLPPMAWWGTAPRVRTATTHEVSVGADHKNGIESVTFTLSDGVTTLTPVEVTFESFDSIYEDKYWSYVYQISNADLLSLNDGACTVTAVVTAVGGMTSQPKPLDEPYTFYNNAGGSLPQATRYIDDANGNDSNAGTSPGVGNAWKTMEHAVDALRLSGELDGARVLMADGWYQAGHTGSPTSGANSEWVTFEPDTANGATKAGVIISESAIDGLGTRYVRYKDLSVFMFHATQGVNQTHPTLATLNPYTNGLIAGILGVYQDEQFFENVSFFGSEWNQLTTAPNGGVTEGATFYPYVAATDPTFQYPCDVFVHDGTAYGVNDRPSRIYWFGCDWDLCKGGPTVEAQTTPWYDDGWWWVIRGCTATNVGSLPIGKNVNLYLNCVSGFATTGGGGRGPIGPSRAGPGAGTVYPVGHPQAGQSRGDNWHSETIRPESPYSYIDGLIAQDNRMQGIWLTLKGADTATVRFKEFLVRNMALKEGWSGSEIWKIESKDYEHHLEHGIFRNLTIQRAHPTYIPKPPSNTNRWNMVFPELDGGTWVFGDVLIEDCIVGAIGYTGSQTEGSPGSGVAIPFPGLTTRYNVITSDTSGVLNMPGVGNVKRTWQVNDPTFENRGAGQTHYINSGIEPSPPIDWRVTSSSLDAYQDGGGWRTPPASPRGFEDPANPNRGAWDDTAGAFSTEVFKALPGSVEYEESMSIEGYLLGQGNVSVDVDALISGISGGTPSPGMDCGSVQSGNGLDCGTVQVSLTGGGGVESFLEISADAELIGITTASMNVSAELSQFGTLTLPLDCDAEVFGVMVHELDIDATLSASNVQASMNCDAEITVADPGLPPMAWWGTVPNVRASTYHEVAVGADHKTGITSVTFYISDGSITLLPITVTEETFDSIYEDKYWGFICQITTSHLQLLNDGKIEVTAVVRSGAGGIANPKPLDEPYVFFNNYGGSLPQKTVYISYSSGVDDPGRNGTDAPGDQWASPQYAAERLFASGEINAGIVKMRAGWYRWGDGTTTDKGGYEEWLTFEPDYVDGATRADVKICETNYTANKQGVKSRYVRMHDVTLIPYNPVESEAEPGQPFLGGMINGPAFGDDDYVYFDTVDVAGTGWNGIEPPTAPKGTPPYNQQPVSSFGSFWNTGIQTKNGLRQYWRNCEIHKLQGGISGSSNKDVYLNGFWRWTRHNHTYDIGSNTYRGVDVILNAIGEDNAFPDAGPGQEPGANWHGSLLRQFGPFFFVDNLIANQVGNQFSFTTSSGNNGLFDYEEIVFRNVCSKDARTSQRALLWQARPYSINVEHAIFRNISINEEDPAFSPGAGRTASQALFEGSWSATLGSAIMEFVDVVFEDIIIGYLSTSLEDIPPGDGGSPLGSINGEDPGNPGYFYPTPNAEMRSVITTNEFSTLQFAHPEPSPAYSNVWRAVADINFVNFNGPAPNQDWRIQGAGVGGSNGYQDGTGWRTPPPSPRGFVDPSNPNRGAWDDTAGVFSVDVFKASPGVPIEKELEIDVSAALLELNKIDVLNIDAHFSFTLEESLNCDAEISDIAPGLKPMAWWATVPNVRVSGDHEVSVGADHKNGIESVTFTLSDGVTTLTPVVVTTETFDSIYTDKYWSFVYPIPYADLVTLNDGPVTVTAVVKAVGGQTTNPSPLNETYKFFNNAGGTLPQRTVYLSPTGDDATGTGTFASPWRTPEKAAEVLFADGDISGGVVKMANGYYQFGDGSATIKGGYEEWLTFESDIENGANLIDVVISESGFGGIGAEYVRFRNLSLFCFNPTQGVNDPGNPYTAGMASGPRGQWPDQHFYEGCFIRGANWNGTGGFLPGAWPAVNYPTECYGHKQSSPETASILRGYWLGCTFVNLERGISTSQNEAWYDQGFWLWSRGCLFTLIGSNPTNKTNVVLNATNTNCIPPAGGPGAGTGAGDNWHSEIGWPQANYLYYDGVIADNCVMQGWFANLATEFHIREIVMRNMVSKNADNGAFIFSLTVDGPPGGGGEGSSIDHGVFRNLTFQREDPFLPNSGGNRWNMTFESTPGSGREPWIFGDVLIEDCLLGWIAHKDSLNEDPENPGHALPRDGLTIRYCTITSSVGSVLNFPGEGNVRAIYPSGDPDLVNRDPGAGAVDWRVLASSPSAYRDGGGWRTAPPAPRGFADPANPDRGAWNDTAGVFTLTNFQVGLSGMELTEEADLDAVIGDPVGLERILELDVEAVVVEAIPQIDVVNCDAALVPSEGFFIGSNFTMLGRCVDTDGIQFHQRRDAGDAYIDLVDGKYRMTFTTNKGPQVEASSFTGVTYTDKVADGDPVTGWTSMRDSSLTGNYPLIAAPQGGSSATDPVDPGFRNDGRPGHTDTAFLIKNPWTGKFALYFTTRPGVRPHGTEAGTGYLHSGQVYPLQFDVSIPDDPTPDPDDWSFNYGTLLLEPSGFPDTQNPAGPQGTFIEWEQPWFEIISEPPNTFKLWKGGILEFSAVYEPTTDEMVLFYYGDSEVEVPSEGGGTSIERRFRIMRATSPDGINWTRNPTPGWVWSAEEQVGWGRGIMNHHPCVTRDSTGMYHLMVISFEPLVVTSLGVGHWISVDQGRTWYPDPANPVVLTGSADPLYPNAYPLEWLNEPFPLGSPGCFFDPDREKVYIYFDGGPDGRYGKAQPNGGIWIMEADYPSSFPPPDGPVERTKSLTADAFVSGFLFFELELDVDAMVLGTASLHLDADAALALSFTASGDLDAALSVELTANLDIDSSIAIASTLGLDADASIAVSQSLSADADAVLSTGQPTASMDAGTVQSGGGLDAGTVQTTT